MRSIAICDDEETAVHIIRETIKEDLNRRKADMEITTYTDSENLYRVLLSGTHYDLLLLDIDMPGLDGISLGTRLAGDLYETLLIYISGREERVFDAFQAKPFRFVRKSRLPQEWPTVMDAVEEEFLRRQKRKVVFYAGGSEIRLRPEEIVYVESFRKNQVLHMAEEEIRLSSNFAAVLEELSGRGFIQIHKSYAVNYRMIRSINKSEVVLDNGLHLPIGRSRLSQVEQEFHRLVLREL